MIRKNLIMRITATRFSRNGLRVGIAAVVLTAGVWFTLPTEVHAFVQASRTVGVTNARNIAQDTARNEVWVTNTNGDQVYRINLSTFAITGTVAVPDHPYHLAVAGAKVFVTHGLTTAASSNLTIIDAATLAKTETTISGSVAPWDLYYDGTNVWAADVGSGNILKLDATTGALLGTYGAAGTGVPADAYEGMYITHGAQFLYVAFRKDGRAGVSKIRRSDGSHQGVFQFDAATAPLPRPIFYNGSVYAMVNGGAYPGVIHIINTGDMTLTARLSGGMTEGSMRLGQNGFITEFTSGSGVQIVKNNVQYGTGGTDIGIDYRNDFIIDPTQPAMYVANPFDNQVQEYRFTAPALTSAVTVSPTETSATVNWTITDNDTFRDSVVLAVLLYGETTPIISSDLTWSSTPQVTINDLAPVTTYQYDAIAYTYIGSKLENTGTFSTSVGPATDEIPNTKIYIGPSPYPTADVNGTAADISWGTTPTPGDTYTYFGTLAPSATDVSIPNNSGIQDMTCVNSTLCWAVGLGGKIWVYAVGTWQQVTSGTANNLKAVSARGTKYVWAVGDNGTVLHSVDGGAHWTVQTTPYGTSAHIYGVAAVSSNEAWAVTSLGTVMRTTDTGNTWAQIGDISSAALQDISFRKTETGALKGCIVGDQGRMWYYAGGTGFTSIATGDAVTRIHSCDVAIGTLNGYWAVGENGKVWKTTSLTPGTAQLITSPQFSGQSFFQVQAYPGGRAWFVGTNSKAFYTDSAGSDWTLLDFGGAGKNLQGLSMDEPTELMVVGENGNNYAYRGIYGTIRPGPAGYTNTHNMTIDGLAESQTYHYKVTSAISDASARVGSWDYTLTAGFSDTTPPDWSAPNINGAQVCSGSTIHYTITWDPATDTGSGIDHYEVWRSLNSTTAYTNISGSIPASAGPPYSYTDTSGLTTSATYRYKVLAYNGAGLPTESPIHTVTTGTKTFNIAWEGPVPLPPHVTVTHGNDGVYQIRVTRDWCFDSPIAWSYVSSTPPSGQPAMAGGMYTFGPEISGVVQMNIATSALGLGTYTNIKVKGNYGTTTKYVDLAQLTIESTDTTVPTAPTLSGSLTCTGTSGRSVELTWTPASDPETGISKYEVYRCLGASCTFSTTPLATLTGSPPDLPPPTTYTDATVSPNLTYKYKVVAYNGGVPPMPITSNIFTKSTYSTDCDNDTTPPTAPVLTVVPVCNASGTQDAQLNWTAATDSVSNIVRYEIFRDGTLVATVPGSQTSYTDTGLAPGTYSYVIDAWNDATPPLKISSTPKTVTLVGSGISVNVINPVNKTVTVASGDPALYTVRVTPSGCFTGTATLSLTAPYPSPVSSTNTVFAPATVNLSGGPANSIMTITTTGFAPGTYQPINITASSTAGNASVPQTPNPVTLIIDNSQCVDGTPNNTCKEFITGNQSDLPLRCDLAIQPDGTLFDKCSVCGCPDWTGNITTDRPYCDTSTEQCILRCSDGTENGQCSTVTPGSFCDLSVGFDPVENCTECEGQSGYCTEANQMCDPATNTCVTDDIPPALTCPVTCVGGPTSMTVTWCTDEDSTSNVDYGLSAAVLSSSSGSTSLVKNHSVFIGPPAATLLADTTYYYQAKSADQFGNLFASPVASCSTASIPDTTPPTCSITAPIDGTVVSGTVPFVADASDNVGIARIDFAAGGVSQGSVSGAPYQVSFDSTAFSDGTLQLTIDGRDAAGLTCHDDILVTVSNDALPPQLVGDVTSEIFNNFQYARVRWSTNEPSVGSLFWGEDRTDQGTWTEVPYTLGISHEVEIGPMPFGKDIGIAIYACDSTDNCGYIE